MLLRDSDAKWAYGGLEGMNVQLDLRRPAGGYCPGCLPHLTLSLFKAEAALDLILYLHSPVQGLAESAIRAC